MDRGRRTTLSKWLALALRHEPAALELALDEGGFAAVEAVLAGFAARGEVVTRDELLEIVVTSDKRRFALDDGDLPADGRDDVLVARGVRAEQDARRDDPRHGGEDVLAVVDEARDAELEADRRLLAPLAAEPQPIGADAGGLEEGVPREPAARARLDARAALRDEPDAPLVADDESRDHHKRAVHRRGAQRVVVGAADEGRVGAVAGDEDATDVDAEARLARVGGETGRASEWMRFLHGRQHASVNITGNLSLVSGYHPR